MKILKTKCEKAKDGWYHITIEFEDPKNLYEFWMKQAWDTTTFPPQESLFESNKED